MPLPRWPLPTSAERYKNASKNDNHGETLNRRGIATPRLPGLLLVPYSRSLPKHP